jgi:hypothetical protein
VGLSSLFVLLIAVSRAIGARQPLPSALAGFVEGCEDKPHPCWYGIVPGLTTQQDVYDLLNLWRIPRSSLRSVPQGWSLALTAPEASPYCGATFVIQRGLLVQFELSPCYGANIRVGDLAALWAGEPIVTSLPPEDMIYGGASMHVEDWPELSSRVRYIMLMPPDADLPSYPWYGFVPRWRYCQLEPRFPRCRLLRK